jgi:hypothetical protein
MASSSLSGNQVIWIDTKMCRVDRFLYISALAATQKEGEDISWSDKKTGPDVMTTGSGAFPFYLIPSVSDKIPVV